MTTKATKTATRRVRVRERDGELVQAIGIAAVTAEDGRAYVSLRVRDVDVYPDALVLRLDASVAEFLVDGLIRAGLEAFGPSDPAPERCEPPPAITPEDLAGVPRPGRPWVYGRWTAPLPRGVVELLASNQRAQRRAR